MASESNSEPESKTAFVLFTKDNKSIYVPPRASDLFRALAAQDAEATASVIAGMIDDMLSVEIKEDVDSDFVDAADFLGDVINNLHDHL